MNKFRFVVKAFFAIVLISYTANLGAFERRSIGSPDAPVVAYDFISLICNHCATFYAQVMPKIKKEYIDTGKVRLVFIDVPFGSPSNLVAHSLLYQTSNPEQFFELVSLFLKEQDKWIKSNNPDALARLFGISPKGVTIAKQDTKLHEWLQSDAKDMLTKLNIKGTPTLLLGPKDGTVYTATQRFEGFTSYEKVKKAIDSMLENG